MDDPQGKPLRQSRPFVSVVMPVLNEEAFIERSLGALLDQDYAPDRLEILVVDGMSSDRTRELVAKVAARARIPIRLIENGARIVPAAMNLGIGEAHGEIILRMDGHSIPASNYVRLSVETLLANPHVDNVGGVVLFVGEDRFSRAAGMCCQSKFGSGGAPARGRLRGPVDTVSFGCWRKTAFERFGMFDESFVRTQDSEFNYRTRRMGGTVWLEPRITSDYYNRSSVTRLARQYFQYGFWKTRLMFKLGGTLMARHLLPPVLTVGLGVSLLMLVAATVLWLLGASSGPVLVAGGLLLPALYFTVVIIAAIHLALTTRDWSVAPLFLLIFPVLHLSWGGGFLWGLARPPRTRA